MSYRTKSGRFMSNRFGVGTGSKNFGDAGAPPPWDMGVNFPLETCSCPRVLPYQMSSLWVKPFWRTYSGPTNMLPPPPPVLLPCHIRSIYRSNR